MGHSHEQNQSSPPTINCGDCGWFISTWLRFNVAKLLEQIYQHRQHTCVPSPKKISIADNTRHKANLPPKTFLPFTFLISVTGFDVHRSLSSSLTLKVTELSTELPALSSSATAPWGEKWNVSDCSHAWVLAGLLMGWIERAGPSV